MDLFEYVILGFLGALGLGVIGFSIYGFIVYEHFPFLDGIKKEKYRKNKPAESTLKDAEQIISTVQKTVVEQLCGNNHVDLFNAIAQQKIILNKHNRKSIAIFITPDTLKDLLNTAQITKTPADLINLYKIIKDFRIPVGYLGDLPIYLSEQLTDAPVFVAGDFKWELNNGHQR